MITSSAEHNSSWAQSMLCCISVTAQFLNICYLENASAVENMASLDKAIAARLAIIKSAYCLQVRSPAGGNPALPSNLLDELSHFVDEALRDMPASCNNLATSNAALASASQTTDSTSSADNQPSADHHAAGTEIFSQLALKEAPVKPQENDEQAVKDSGCLGSSASVCIGSKKVNKPAWAMTADAAHDAEQQEEDDLLAFAGGLQFDRYINQQEDAELRTILQVTAA